MAIKNKIRPTERPRDLRMSGEDIVLLNLNLILLYTREISERPTMTIEKI